MGKRVYRVASSKYASYLFPFSRFFRGAYHCDTAGIECSSPQLCISQSLHLNNGPASVQKDNALIGTKVPGRQYAL